MCQLLPRSRITMGDHECNVPDGPNAKVLKHLGTEKPFENPWNEEIQSQFQSSEPNNVSHKLFFSSHRYDN